MMATPNDWFYDWSQNNLGKVVGAGRNYEGYGTKISATTGWPDFLIKLPGGELGFFEVKDGTKREPASPAQVEAMRELESLGVVVQFAVKNKENGFDLMSIDEFLKKYGVWK